MADLEINPAQLIEKFRALYPREFNHAVAELRGDLLQARVEALEAAAQEREAEE